MFPASHAAHEKNVRALPCVVTGGKSTLHHAQGPSVSARLATLDLPHKGIGQRGNGPALLLPLRYDLHYFGPEAIDGGIGRATWEAKYGAQSDMLDRVGEILGYSLWDLHQLWLPPSKILPRRFL